MTRPATIHIDALALRHNVNRVKQLATGRKIIAMVKANAYGCGIANVIPVLEGHVDAFGIACLEEALAIRALGARTDCVLIQGVFSADELPIAAAQRFQCVIHQPHQLRWLLEKPLSTPIKVWVKVNTGMGRLGFSTEAVYDVLNALASCAWVDKEIGLMTHFSSADEPDDCFNHYQLQSFQNLTVPQIRLLKSMANSAAIIALPESHADVVRPGIMLYGISPFSGQTGRALGLLPVMQFTSAISAIHYYPAGTPIGYGATWCTEKPSCIGIVAVGYGDGYPRCIEKNTPVWINGVIAPIVGRVSMDMITVDLSNCPNVAIGDMVELWGKNIPVETIASSAGTIGYELLCRFKPR